MKLVSTVRAVGLGLGLWLFPSLGTCAPTLVYSFGVLNQQAPAEAAAIWNPLLSYLGRKTGHRFEFRMGATVKETDRLTALGHYDFLFSNHVFDPEYDKAGYRVIAKLADPLVGQILVAENSPYRQLADLKGQNVAFPSPDAFIAYEVTTQALRRAGIVVTKIFSGNQESSLIQLSMGRTNAASVNKRFADRYQLKHKIKFRALYVSDDYPNIPVLVHPRIPVAVMNAVQKVLVDMRTDPEGRRLLENSKSPGFVFAQDSEYMPTRALYREPR